MRALLSLSLPLSLALALAGCSRPSQPAPAESPAPAPQAQAQPQALAQPQDAAAAPIEPIVIKGRRIDIEAGKGGYHPERVTVAAGEEVTLVFTRTVKSHCLSEIMIPSLKVKKELPLNQPVAIPFTPTRSGDVAFSCGMDMIHGTIAVE